MPLPATSTATSAKADETTREVRFRKNLNAASVAHRPEWPRRARACEAKHLAHAKVSAPHSDYYDIVRGRERFCSRHPQGNFVSVQSRAYNRAGIVRAVAAKSCG